MTDRRRARTRMIALVLAMIAAVVTAVAGQRMIAGHAFDALEADTVAGDAHRVAVALTFETRLLSSYGSTNSIWDDSYDDVAKADRAAFEADFPPADQVGMYGVDGLLGIDAGGTVRVGGLAAGTRFVAPPAVLGPARLAAMVDVHGAAGSSRCGAVTTGGVPYLYCGFPARRSDGSGAPRYGLIFLMALSPAHVAALARTTGLALRVVPAAASGGSPLNLTTGAGRMRATTRVTGDDRVELTMTVPALGGGALVLQSLHPRPIHATDTRTARETFLLLGACAAVLLLLVLLLVRNVLRDQIAPLRATTEHIISSGDRSARIPSSGSGEIAALGNAVNQLLDAIAAQAEEVERAQVEREQRIIVAHQHQERTEAQARERAQEVIEATVAAVSGELSTVLQQANLVRNAAGEISERTVGADALTEEALRDAAAADAALGDLNASLAHVDEIVATITTITGQTRILALNASIEAERAGAVGSGFRVVADEVRSLSGDTATSATQIAETTGRVSAGARQVSTTLGGVTSRVAAVSEATRAMRDVVGEQTATVAELADIVRRALERVKDMGRVSEHLERRGHERLPAFGYGTMTLRGTRVRTSVRDVSATGLAVGLPEGWTVAAGEHARLELPAELGGLTLEVEVAWSDTSTPLCLAGLRAVTGGGALAEQVRVLRTRYDTE